MDVPRIIGHRGAAARAPENTLAAIRSAKALGVRWVEIDLRLTRDRCPVLLHDERVDRTTNGQGAVKDWTMAALARLDAGAWFAPEFRGEPVPSLAAALDLLRELRLGVVLELKASAADAVTLAAAVAEELRRGWADHLPPPLLSSFEPVALMAARQAAPTIARALVCGRAPGDWRERVAALGLAALHLDHRRLDRAWVARASAELPIFAYTVNQPARAETLFAWGVSAVFTDAPDLLNSLTEPK